ncbi:papilin isoform X2 [Erinaceus europaeus]|uniref:Papilin isoform X2 n=1 Tax=Erinaceus europaeus TaxID=9365 RepID=A0ABM3W4G6_ERIEU|nr:papilin isoform X2 [Erinaceus europaeus]
MRPLLLVPLLLAASASASSAPRVRRSDAWGSWGGWSPCTRTCGGGISFRERPCSAQRPDGGPGCVGPARSYRMCHPESCPEGAPDFRAQQCAEFDGQEFQGRRYKWLPYYAAPNKCELNCIPHGESFYFRHREAVTDGTPCEPGGRDVCVDGSCRVVGCDLRLDSTLQEDECLRCGGDGSTCYPVTGTFDASGLSRGYNRVLVVPAGATSIRVEEGAASRNFLAVRNVRGDYYLNGHWNISAAQALPVASTLLHYERGAEGDLAPERLYARGPTSEPLVIELISQQPGPWVLFEYHLPRAAPQTRVRWSHGSWSDCSAQCGGGRQSRLVVCTVDSEASPDHECRHQPRPAEQRPCSPQPCPQTGHWKTGPWGPCSASCGGGSQSRSVHCASAGCSGSRGKPPSTRACGLQRCAAWSAEPWGECSGSCGAGVRRRNVTCRGAGGSPLPSTACSRADRPPLAEPCARDCPHLSDRAWRVGTWSLCSQSCDSGTRRRRVVCALGPPGYCGRLQLPKPVAVEACNAQPCPLPPVPHTQAVNTSPRHSPTSLGLWRTPTAASRDQDPHLPASGPAPSLQQPLGSDLGGRDCRHSPHGCCPDGHTASLGPQWQGCPGTSCEQSRKGCARAQRREDAGGVPGAGAPAEPQGQRSQQDEPGACRGSRFGCCYDDVAPAAGPLGEGCAGQPSYAYPVRCLLPSALGSCADWAARWYFVPSVGRCNRFWYGGCHGNANNFASEGECMSSCLGAQRAPLRPGPSHAPRASAQGTRGEGGGSGPGPTGQSRPLPSGGGGIFWPEQEPRPSETHRTPPYAEQAWGQELGPRASTLGGGDRGPAPPSHGSSRAGSEPSLVQAAQGQLVQLYCPDSASRAGWRKDRQPIASDRHRLQPDGSLLIGPLRAEDAGTYSCGSIWPGRASRVHLRVMGGDVAVLKEAQHRNPAQNHRKDTVSSSQLRPQTRLRLDRNQPGVVEAYPGQQIRLTCRAEGFPPPTIEWQRDGQRLASPRHQRHPDGSLVISRVAAEDRGFYACVAFNGQDRDQHWVQLRVLEGLTITGTPSAVTVPEGDTARLPCVVAGGSVNVRWSRNGLPVRADGRRVHQSPDGTLLIRNLGAGDEGSYTCSAYRGNQSASRSTEVKVAPPALVAPLRDPGRDCIDQPELANCELILQAQLCGNEYYSSFCCASCYRTQPQAQPVWQDSPRHHRQLPKGLPEDG